MSYYSKCPAGHFFSSSLNACPACAEMGGAPKTTVVPDSAGSSGDTTRTRVIVPEQSSDDGTKTKPVGDVDTVTKRTVDSGQASAAPNEVYTERTTIIRRPPADGSASEHSGSDAEKNQTLDAKIRCLGGWLITYTWNKQGTDFRLFEGKNTIGRAAASQIRIPEDESISGLHATITLREGKFYLKEEGPSNAIRINGVEVDMGAFVQLNDGDVLEFGRTKLLFRSALH